MTDGQIALLVNRIVRCMRRIDRLPQHYGEAARLRTEPKLRTRIADLLDEIAISDHVSASQITNSLQYDVAHWRVNFVAAGARRFFQYPANWIVDKKSFEVKAIA